MVCDAEIFGLCLQNLMVPNRPLVTYDKIRVFLYISPVLSIEIDFPKPIKSFSVNFTKNRDIVALERKKTWDSVIRINT